MNPAAQKVIFDSDIQVVESELNAINVYWLGKTLVGIRQGLGDSLLGMDAGYEQQYDFPINLRISQFSSVRQPKTEEFIEIDNPDASEKDRPRIPLRIKTRNPSEDGVWLTIGVKADN